MTGQTKMLRGFAEYFEIGYNYSNLLDVFVQRMHLILRQENGYRS